MQDVISISQDDLVQHLRLACQIPQMVKGFVVRKIITAVAEVEGITATPEELQQAADSLRLANNLRQTEETWAWLQQHHLTLEEFEAIARTSVVTSKLAKHLFLAQVEPYFWEHNLEYTKAVIYEILLDDAELVQELYYALQEGDINFHEIAHQYIQDPESRRLGGFRGLITRNELRPEIAAAVYAAEPPQVLEPITSPQGIHLILVEEIIQPQLDDMLRSNILSRLFSEWLKQQIKQKEIKVNITGSQSQRVAISQ